MIKTHTIPLNVQLVQFRNTPKTVVTADILLRLLLLDSNSKDRDMLEVNDNNIELKILKIHETYRSNTTSQGNPITRLIIKSNDSVALVWEVSFELHLLSLPLILIQPSWLKCPHSDRRHLAFLHGRAADHHGRVGMTHNALNEDVGRRCDPRERRRGTVHTRIKNKWLAK